MTKVTENKQKKTFDLVAVDLDGTLLDDSRRLSCGTEQTIRNVRNRGVRVVIASARPPRTVRDIYTALELDTLQINYNGALIHDPLTGRRIHYQPLDGELAMTIAADARKHAADIVVSVEILDKWYTDRFEPRFATETSRLFRPDVIAPLPTFLNQPITKLMLLGVPDVIAILYDKLTRRYAEVTRQVMCDDHLIQIMHPSVNKGDALGRVAAYYGITPERIMAIGDAPNDIDMFDHAGLSIAVGNAWPAVKADADVIVPPNNNDGVAAALQRYILDTE